MSNYNMYNVLIRPINTEKSLGLASVHQKVFLVQKDATKLQIKRAIMQIFDLQVREVNVMNYRAKRKIFKGKKGLRTAHKKAIVTFANAVDFDEVFGG